MFKTRSECNFLFPTPFFAKVKQHKSPANRAKIGGRVHFDFPKENRVKCTVRLEPDSFSGRIIPMLMKQEHGNLRTAPAPLPPGGSGYQPDPLGNLPSGRP